MFIKELAERRKVQLQMFNGEPTDPPAAPADPPATPPATPPAADPPAIEGGKPQPFATFPDEKSFLNRVKREAKTLQSEFLKSLGVDDPEGLKTIIETHNQSIESAKTDLTKAQERADKADKDRLAVLDRANNIARKTSAQLIANELGVNPKRIDHFIKLADINTIEVSEDGTVDRTKMTESLDALLKELPEFKTTQPPAQGGGDFGGGGNNTPPTLTIEKIKTMSSKEIADNIGEVRKVLAQAGK